MTCAFSFLFFLAFMFIQRLNEFSVSLHATFLLISCFPIALADLPCMHRHQTGKGREKRRCHLGHWGKEKQNGIPNIRQNYVTKLKFEIKKLSFSEVSVQTVLSWFAFDFWRSFLLNPVLSIFLPVTGSQRLKHVLKSDSHKQVKCKEVREQRVF